MIRSFLKEKRKFREQIELEKKSYLGQMEKTISEAGFLDQVFYEFFLLQIALFSFIIFYLFIYLFFFFFFFFSPLSKKINQLEEERVVVANEMKRKEERLREQNMLTDEVFLFFFFFFFFFFAKIDRLMCDFFFLVERKLGKEV